MSDDLVKRLDQINQDYDFARGVHGTIREAKDRVQALQAQNLRLSGMVHDLTAERDGLLRCVTDNHAALYRAKTAEAERDRLRDALGEMLSRHILYCGGPDLPHAGHTDVALFAKATAAMEGKGQVEVAPDTARDSEVGIDFTAPKWMDFCAALKGETP